MNPKPLIGQLATTSRNNAIFVLRSEDSSVTGEGFSRMPHWNNHTILMACRQAYEQER
ncbi:hypothetical protein ALO61_102113 [Pseudomonas savastanoi pv. nerii]|uniref:Uncharacterized protein n=5 Tax=Pseudomonas syringae group TaxID=136849 RepID=A0A3M6B092_PSESS|nr:hypothetical protein ALO78_101993 [Pseudomonas amygdali pv. ciccaronei]KPW94044.1 hypothetical protein ALO79_100574 [Pseudomonas syringae pv. castaneae]KPX87280.1 hypothetical protein ALO64_100538 [Pseudomonas meliae]KPY09538.1 hypothetical protein ALO61_102113 [Pseudomonas savastanoi pv. nerii]KUG45213.1 hypothetical protein ALP79_102195 [Pseudomonas savastanoi pv. fraxini]RML77207.1 hypothetical protein ALQ90_102026 [Pseudomonas savastanoi pv. savastanoi]RMM00726.1 hypothetical protein A